MADPTERELLARIDPQLDAALKKNIQVLSSLGMPKPGIEGSREMTARTRKYWNEGGPQMHAVRELTVPGPTRDVPVVVYHPVEAQGLPVFVYLHPGGYRFGNPQTNDRQMREIAQAWGGIVVSADYLHMPEHVFPAAVEETAAVYEWLARNGAKWGIEATRMAIGGASTGANIALGALVHLGGTRQAAYIKAGVAIHAVLDDDLEAHSVKMFSGGHFYPHPKGLAEMFSEYVPDPAQRSDPRFNIARADPAIFPPLFIAVAELDTLRDSSTNLAARLAAAGRPHRMKIYEAMTHMFFGFTRSVDRAQECVRDIAQFLAEELPATPG